MRKSRFTESQIVTILKDGDAGTPIGELLRKHNISSATYYKWKARYGGLDASDLKKLRDQDRELSQLKRMYADLALENTALKDLIHRKL